MHPYPIGEDLLFSNLRKINSPIGYRSRSEAHRGKSVAVFPPLTAVRVVGGERAKVFTLMSFGMGGNRAIVLAMFVYPGKKRAATFLRPYNSVRMSSPVEPGRKNRDHSHVH